MIEKEKYCPKCGNLMKICKRNDAIDKISFRCHKRNPSHDTKYNIRAGTIFENFQIKKQKIYFLIYFCFIENNNISTTYEKAKSFCQQIDETPTSVATI